MRFNISNCSDLFAPMSGEERDDLGSRLEEKYTECGNGCWPAICKFNASGTPVMMFRGRTLRVHNVMYFFHVGIYTSRKIHTSCGDKGCLNPDHFLKPGTPKPKPKKEDGPMSAWKVMLERAF